MKKLRIDNKWSVEFDDTENDSPKHWYRYDEAVKSPIDNIHVALFYALLDARSNRMTQAESERAAVEEMRAACEEFVRKVECGEARSKRSYAQIKSSLSHLYETYTKDEKIVE